MINSIHKEISVIKLLLVSSSLLIIGHFMLQNYMPNAIVRSLVFCLLSLIISYSLLVKRDIFFFVMTIYICSHFNYGDIHGGLWNILAFVMLLFYFLIPGKKGEFNQKSILTTALLLVFIFHNIAGSIFNSPMPVIDIMKGLCVFFAYIFMFLIAGNMHITAERFRIFISITFLMLVYQFIIALVQYYSIVNWGSPLVGGNTIDMVKIEGASRPSGTLQNFELFAEYALLMACIAIPFLSSKSTKSEVGFRYIYLSIMIFVSVAVVIITSMRAATVLIVLVTLFYYLFFPFRIVSAVNYIRQQLKIIILIALLLPAVSVYIGMKELTEDFQKVDVKSMNVENIASGSSINRGGLISFAMRRMESESWIIGYGFGVPSSNKWAWWGVGPSKQDSLPADYHNLYLELPMIYGWFGSIAFLGLILSTMYRLMSVTLRFRKKESYLLVLSLGLSVMWGVFLIHEYKIGMLRNTNYQMIFWIWLGLSSSVIKTIQHKFQILPDKVDRSISLSSSNKIGINISKGG